jgi:DNA-binding MarR family transcriptional regulator
MTPDRAENYRPAQTEGTVVDLPVRRKVPFENWKAIDMEILKALSNPTYGFSGLEYLVLMNLVLHAPYEDPANLSIGDLAKLAGDQDRSNMSKLLKKLEAQNVIGRTPSESRIWINPRTRMWITKDAMKEAAKATKGVVPQHPTPPVVPEHHTGVCEYHGVGCPNTTEVGCSSTTGVGCHNTTPGDAKSSESAEPASPLDHGLDLLETHGENIFSSGGQRAKEEEFAENRRALLEQCGKRMAELGFKLPEKQLMLGAPIWHQLRLVIERTCLKKAIDQDNGFVRNEVDYLKEFLLPAIEHLPVEYRGTYSAWTKQFNFKLSECRKLGAYMNLWEDEKKARSGSSGTYGKVSSGFDAPDFVPGVVSADDKRRIAEAARARRAAQ